MYVWWCYQADGISSAALTWYTQQPQTGFHKHGLDRASFSLFCINLILQKKISATPDLREGLNEPMKQIQLRSNAVIYSSTEYIRNVVENRNVKKMDHKAQETNRLTLHGFI